MSEQNKHTDDLKLIRKMMEDSSRFLSLSGLSGVFIGLFAIIGAIAARIIVVSNTDGATMQIMPSDLSQAIKFQLLIVAIVTLVAALGIAYILAKRESKIRGNKIWTPVTKKLLINLVVPLLTGTVIIIVLFVKGDTDYLAATMLIFYGLALYNAGKFTFGEVQYLGVLEILTGLIAAFIPGIGLILWAFGFGLLHILYGIILHKKYK